MQDVSEWDEDYILNLPQGEHDWLEFKSSQKLDLTLPGVTQSLVSEELSKQLSAFANSGGGTIVYGIKDSPIGTPRTIDQHGGVSLGVKNGTKEWLEDIIPNLLEYPISSFNVYVVTATGPASKISAGKGIFLIEVANSEAAPHQALDKKYYARVGGKSQPIGHRFVMDIVGRAKFPKLAMVCSIGTKNTGSGQKDTLLCTCMNVGRVFANYVNGYIYVPKPILKDFGDPTMEIDGTEYRRKWFDNTHEDIVGYRKGHMSADSALTISRYDPVLPGLGFNALHKELAFERTELDAYRSERILWEIFADNAPVEKGSVLIGDIPI